MKPEILAELVKLCELGLGYKKISQQLGINVNTAKSAIRRHKKNKQNQVPHTPVSRRTKVEKTRPKPLNPKTNWKFDPEICKILGVSKAKAAKWAQTVVERYSEPQRHYHTLQHVERMIALWHRLLPKEDPQYLAVYLSILFHDIVYEPTSKTNEIDSISEFDEFANDIGTIDPAVIEQVKLNIESTINHIPLNDQAKLFLDFDLEILSASPPDYDSYAQQIRQEYHFVKEFNTERIKVLKKFLERDSIYFDEEFKSSVNSVGIPRESAARNNLQCEIDRLATSHA
jgi:predicted metal-dependent HD superfamily phosphohydrolase